MMATISKAEFEARFRNALDQPGYQTAEEVEAERRLIGKLYDSFYGIYGPAEPASAIDILDKCGLFRQEMVIIIVPSPGESE